MSYLKNVYLYFLSLKKLSSKLFREIFFSTNFYNKLLISENPARLFFYPNPYLLSPFLNHKSFLFKITKDDVENFWNKNKNLKESKNIHNFLWLNLLDRKNEKHIIQVLVKDWIEKYGNYKKDIWHENVLNKRIIAWISNAEIILEGKDKNFQELFFRSIIKQINFIKKNINSNSNDIIKISSISVLILSGLVFKEYYNNYNTGLKELKKIIENFFDKDGFPKNRNFENLIIFLQYFVLIKEWIKNAQENMPECLDEIIEKNLICLNSLNNTSKKVPLFNGSTERNLEYFFDYLNKLNYSHEKKLESVGQVQIIKNKKTTLYFDSGEPPIHQLSKDYQSGPLSFEYFSENEKVITNCGYGRKISKKTQLISKFTSAQSTLCLNDTSVVKFKRNNLINKAYGPTINNSFKIFDIDRNEDKTNITLSATHNAYLKNFGYLHKRTIKFLKKHNNIIGNDFLFKKKDKDSDVNFSIRFHLYPGVSAIETVSGKSILLQINKKSWIFLSNNGNVQIEKSLFLGRNKILNNQCIVIYGTTKNEDANIQWELKKSN